MEEEEDRDECEPESVLSFSVAQAAFQTVHSFFYLHNIDEPDENILNVERVLFGLKHKVSVMQLSIKVFLGVGTIDLHIDIKKLF
jgi:hypothetical protein